MRDPGVGGTPADACHPFPEDRRVHQRVLPDRPGDARIFFGDLQHGAVRDQRDFRRRQCPDAVIHRLQDEALRVENVAGAMERHDLPFAIDDDLVTADAAAEEQLQSEGRSPSTAMSSSAPN